MEIREELAKIASATVQRENQKKLNEIEQLSNILYKQALKELSKIEKSSSFEICKFKHNSLFAEFLTKKSKLMKKLDHDKIMNIYDKVAKKLNTELGSKNLKFTSGRHQRFISCNYCNYYIEVNCFE